MKKGLKIRKNNLDLISKYDNIFDFFEIYIDPKFPLNKLKKYSDKRITIHAAHYEDRFDPSNKDSFRLNKIIIEVAAKAADIVNAPWIIIHTGHNLSSDSQKNAFSFFDKFWDTRFIFENCPAIDNTENGLKYLFSLPNELKNLIDRYKTGMILDFAHAICTANTLNLDVNEVINGFFKLEPVTYHISGIDLDSDSDTHLHLYEVKNSMGYLKKMNDDKLVTFETPDKDLRDKSKHLKDIEFLNKVMQK